MAIDVEHAIEELKGLPVAERLRVVEAVWESMSQDPAPPPLSPGQRAELDRRLDAYEANPEDVLTWDEVLERLRGRL
jgi:putative addiction module component (TIGR02574 family)